MIQLTNMQGSVLQSQLLISGEAVNASDLSAGCYFVRVGHNTPIKWLKID